MCSHCPLHNKCTPNPISNANFTHNQILFKLNSFWLLLKRKKNHFTWDPQPALVASCNILTNSSFPPNAQLSAYNKPSVTFLSLPDPEWKSPIWTNHLLLSQWHPIHLHQLEWPQRFSGMTEIHEVPWSEWVQRDISCSYLRKHIMCLSPASRMNKLGVARA